MGIECCLARKMAHFARPRGQEKSRGQDGLGELLPSIWKMMEIWISILPMAMKHCPIQPIMSASFGCMIYMWPDPRIARSPTCISERLLRTENPNAAVTEAGK